MAWRARSTSSCWAAFPQFFEERRSNNLRIACRAVHSSDQSRRALIPELRGRLVAVGISGAGAVRVVGTFYPGGPSTTKPAVQRAIRRGKRNVTQQFLKEHKKVEDLEGIVTSLAAT